MAQKQTAKSPNESIMTLREFCEGKGITENLCILGQVGNAMKKYCVRHNISVKFSASWDGMGGVHLYPVRVLKDWYEGRVVLGSLKIEGNRIYYPELWRFKP